MSRGIIEIPIEVWEGCERDAERIAFLHKQLAALAAENERLRKAGDAMAESINFDDQRTWEDWGNQGKSLLRDCVIDWIIAKRGDEK